MSLRRKMAVVAWVYLAEGFPMGIFRDVWPVYLREGGVALRWVGLLGGLYLAWSLKPLWSPLVDRFGERRQWIAGGLLGVAASLLLVPVVGLEAAPWLVLGAMALLCVASATQDIAIDAYTIGLVDRGEEGPANAVRINAYRVALLVSGAGLLPLAKRAGWEAAHLAAAGLALALVVGLRACPRVAVPEKARHDWRGAFRPWWRREGLVGVALFVLLYRLGDFAIAPMLKPFWVDRGYDLDEIALVSNGFGSAATMLGAALGGWIVARVGIGRALLVLGVLAVASNLGYAVAAGFPATGRAGVYTASLVESACGGLAAAGFMAFLMRICDRDHAAVQYAVLSGLYALPGTAAGAVSGAAVESVGYAPWFLATAAVAAPAFLFLPAARRWADEAE